MNTIKIHEDINPEYVVSKWTKLINTIKASLKKFQLHQIPLQLAC